MDLRDFQRRKEELTRLEARVNKTKGIRSQLMRDLKDHGCDSLESANTLIAELDKRIENAGVDYDAKLRKMDKKYKGKL